MWALIENNEVIILADNPGTDHVSGLKRRRLKDYRWVNVTTDTGTATLGDAYYNGKFIGPVGVEETNDPIVVSKYSSYYKWVDRKDVMSTTSTSFADYLTITTDDLSDDDYRLAWCYSWNHNATSSDIEVEIVQVDHNGNDVVLHTHRQEPKDSGGSFGSTGTDQKYSVMSFRVLPLTGINTFTIRFRSTRNKVYASVWDATIDIVKVDL